jgi:NAD(P)-dependent dehydrogenase (short-subunit alcohol dehydrogenase family)
LPGIKLVVKLWDYRKSARKSARRYSAGTYVSYILEASECASGQLSAQRSLRLNVKMIFARKGSPGEGRIVMAGISKSNTEKDIELLGNRVALVTGGSRGIGRAIAIRLAELGAAVAICGRDTEKLRATADELHARTEGVFWQTADVTRADDVAKLVSAAEAKLGPIEILVNNAGIGLFGPAHEKSEEDWDRVLNTNLKSVFLVSRAVVPSMIKKGAGDIINISSLAGRNTFAGGGLYCASKWGVQGLSGSMAEDLRGYGIRVSVICPGSVATEFSGHTVKDASKALQPEDVAHAVEAVVRQRPGSFVSEIQVRPLRKS